MKKLFSLILILCIFSSIAHADCDWSKGVTPGPNHTYVYTEACHLAVGNLVQTNQVQAQQIQDLNQAISLKNLAITYDDQRVALWQKSADDELQRMNSIEKDQKDSNLLYFGLGVVFTAISVYGASQLTHR